MDTNIEAVSIEAPVGEATTPDTNVKKTPYRVEDGNLVVFDEKHRLWSNVKKAMGRCFGLKRMMTTPTTIETETVLELMSYLKELYDYDHDLTPAQNNDEGTIEHDEVEFFEFMEEMRSQRIAMLKEMSDKGEWTFEDLPAFYEDKMIAFKDEVGQLVVGKVTSVELRHTWTGVRYHIIQFVVISMIGNKPMRSTMSKIVLSYEGTMKVADLAVQLATPEQVAMAVARGRTIFEKFGGKRHFVEVSGQLYRAGWGGIRSFRTDGRVMIDPVSWIRMEQNTWRDCRYGLGMNGEEEFESTTISDDDYAIVVPWLGGFSFRLKAWGMFRFEDVSEIKWRSDAYQRLVLDPKKKEMVRALVEYSGVSFGDVVEGKSGGCIFLLHGEPGQGKTLTAEVVAELLKRPLYSISVGELGTHPDMLEKRLREILDLAHGWNAVILLDEADIFLERRTSDDILRNAMVGVFLRLLEYHPGVLFLTTNRVKDIDPAFFSRISMAMSFDGGSREKREAIWRNLLGAAGVDLAGDGDPFYQLSLFDLNGRQIKNVIRATQTLVLADGGDPKKLDLHMLADVISETTAFQHEMEGR